MAWLDENSIRAATERVCIALQSEARGAHMHAVRYVEIGLLGRAAQEQRSQAQSHREMRERLERLIGVA